MAAMVRRSSLNDSLREQLQARIEIWYENIPVQLQSLEQWVLWKAIPKASDPTKYSKIPYTTEGQEADTTDPHTWTTFNQVCEAFALGGYAGIGFVFDEGDPFCGIDLDGGVSDTGLRAEHWELLQLFNSYSEYSPTGSGIHIIVRATLPGSGEGLKNKTAGLEMYDRGRYFTFTGDRVADTPETINLAQQAVTATYRKYKPVGRVPADPSTNGHAPPLIPQSSERTDSEVLQQALGKAGSKAWKVYDGDYAAHSEDHSATDYWMCLKLLGVSKSVDQVRNLMAASHMASWQDKSEAYQETTLQKAYARVLQDDLKAEEAEIAADIQTRTELGLSERIAKQHGQDIRFVYGLGKGGAWLIWNGKCWAEDAGEQIQRRAKRTVLSLYEEAKNLEDDEQRKAFRKFIASCETRKTISNAVALTRDIEGITATLDSFDSNPDLLNCENGVVNLRTGELLPHDRKYLCRRMAAAYDPDMPTPLWTGFLQKFFGHQPGFAEFIQISGGYSLTGYATEKNFWLCIGDLGNNGKSTTLAQLRRCHGTYAGSIALSVLTAPRKHEGGDPATPSLLSIKGARYVDSDEIPEQWSPNIALLKSLTSGGMDNINVRGLYVSNESYKPTQKLFLFGNQKPKMPSEDQGLWNRALLVPFTYAIPKAEQINNFSDLLAKETPGILAWFAQGARRWYETGLVIPDFVKRATDAYRDEMDYVKLFVNEMCEVNPEHHVIANDLYNAWESWRKGKCPPMEKNRFGRRITKAGFGLEEKRIQGRTHTIRTGLRLTQSFGLAHFES